MKLLLPAALITAVSSGLRLERNALPQEIFRDDVEPSKGGKVPEAAHLRVELNMIDSVGLWDPEGIRMEQLMAAESPELLDHMLQDTNSNYQPGLTPALRLKPKYHPETSPLSFGTHSAQQSYPQPQPAYTPQPYIPPAPVGPVLLKTRPYEVKSVQSLPITVSETYTSFDCRSKPYPGRHYADAETGCEIYHFCHEDGKQDTFQCGYGTVFNEYIGTCDFINSVQCLPGKGYAPKRTPVQHAPYAAHTSNQKPTKYAHSASLFHKKPVPYTKPKRYYEPTTKHKPILYMKPAPYKKPALHSKPNSYHKPGTYSQKTQQSSGPHTATGKTLADPIKPFTHFGKK